MGLPTVSIVLNTHSIDFTHDPVSNNLADSFAYSMIAEVDGIYNAKPLSAIQSEWAYPFNAMTILIIRFRGADKTPYQIDLQRVSNQATWSTGTLVGLQTAIAAIQAKMT